MTLQSASDLLKRAVELDTALKYSESLICYEEGIQMLIRLMKDIKSDVEKKQLYSKVEKYLARAEEIKELVKAGDKDNFQCMIYNPKLEPIYHLAQHVKCTQIKAGDTGFGYSTVFGPCLDNNITDVTVQDPYIKARHQVHNFVRFCELLVQRCDKLQSIILITTQADSNEQTQWLSELRGSLRERSVSLEIHFSSSLHDREVRFSNGWIVKIGRGLDYFQKPKGQFTIGFSNYNLRPCLETTIETFHRLNTQFVHTKK